MQESNATDITGPVENATDVTPDDGVTFSATRALYIGAAGAVRVLHSHAVSPTSYPVTIAGMIYPWSVVKVYATGTTATDIKTQY